MVYIPRRPYNDVKHSFKAGGTSVPLETIGSPALWAGFILFVIAMLAIDLGVFHRKAHEVSLREAALWSAVWVTLSLIFNFGVYVWFGAERALEFTTG